MAQLYVVVLAAGKGKRMRSKLPKVLHPLCGRPMLSYILESAAELTDHILVVVGHGAFQIKAVLGEKWHYVLQEKLLGTGHAVMQALKDLPPEGALLVLCGDTPLLEAGHLHKLLDHHERQTVKVLTTILPDPTGYGRVIRDPNNLIERIVEERDASDREREICEINTGTYFFDLGLLNHYLPLLTTENAQREYYLTDIIALMSQDGHKVGAYLIDDYRVSLGINNRIQLAEAGSLMRKRINQSLMLKGVTIVDPDSTYIDYDVQIGSDTEIRPNCVIESGTIIGSGCQIGPNTHLRQAVIKDLAVVQHSVIIGNTIARERKIGPFAHSRFEKMEK